MIKINKQLVEKIKWQDDPDNFDKRLQALGQGLNEFVVVNPIYDPWILNFIDINSIEYSDQCLVFHINNTWIIKKFNSSWTPTVGWKLIECEIEKNPNAQIVVEYNPALAFKNFNLSIDIPYHDAVYEHVYYLNDRFNTEKIWIAKAHYLDVEVQEVKNIDIDLDVSPVVEYNSELFFLKFDIDASMPFADAEYEYVYYLDEKYDPDGHRPWVAKVKYPNIEIKGVKDRGAVSPTADSLPKIIYNPDIPKLKYHIADSIPYYDFNFEHVWMLPDELHNDVEKIWAAKMVPNGPSSGVKHAGYINIAMDEFDVVFISYYEPNAEANWQRVLEICPTAKRVKNVQGIFQAHKKAAELAATEMFYVVDGDAELVDNWQFNYRPNLFDMDAVHLWTSINPINDLEYGWGGVKLFPRKLLLDATTWKVDLTTGLGKLIYLNKVSNINKFNTDPFNTWRSAFRECAKLSAKIEQGFESDQELVDAQHRLHVWNTAGQDRHYGKYALNGAHLGTKYGAINHDKLDKLKLINDYDWMKNEFNEFYKFE